MPALYSADLSRRSAITLLGASVGLLAIWRRAVSLALAEGTLNLDGDLGSLEPGQFIWAPERAPEGPVAIIVSIPKQLVFVYRNGILIGVSTCSTSKPGHSTPAGVFTILDKAKVHTSATYGEPMPDMERLTWKGIALHVGDLPGYPDSHGCVHLPPDFADDLYAITQIGTPVILAGGHTDPASVADPGPILGTTAREEIEAKIGGKPIPSLSPNAVMSILVSRGDMKIYVPRSWPRAPPSSRTRRSRSAQMSSCGRAATRTAPAGRAWASMPAQAFPPRLTPTCFNASMARPT
jgi:hypothetical protein